MNTRPQDDGVPPVTNRIVGAEVETDVETDVEVDAEGNEPDDERQVAPANSDGFRLGGEPPRVMRLSRKALATIGILASVGIGGASSEEHTSEPQSLMRISYAVFCV